MMRRRSSIRYLWQNPAAVSAALICMRMRVGGWIGYSPRPLGNILKEIYKPGVPIETSPATSTQQPAAVFIHTFTSQPRVRSI